jgi:uncharacterized protein (DUF1684 family)
MIRKVLGMGSAVVAVLGLNAILPAGAARPSFSVTCNAYPGDTVVTVEGGTDTVHLDYYTTEDQFAGSPGFVDVRSRTATQATFDAAAYVIVQTLDHQGNLIRDDGTHYTCT